MKKFVTRKDVARFKVYGTLAILFLFGLINTATVSPAFNYTNLSNATSLTDIAIYLNNYTNNVFGIMIVVSAFAIIFLSTKNFFTPHQVIATAMFICLIITILLSVIGMVPDKMLAIVIILFAGSLIALYKGHSDQ